jgi:ComF family protein
MFILERIISVAAPHLCIGCGAEGVVVCDWCLPDFASPLPSRCYRCKSQTENSLVCKKCRHGSRMKHVWTRTAYEDRAKLLIHDFKFERKQAAAKPIAQMMAEILPYFPPDTIVTHVPTATSRVRQRGYDHAGLLAKALAHELELSHVSLLRRTGQARQVGAKRSERLRQLDGAFHASDHARCSGSQVLLVDDLVTTGGTLESAAKTLRQAGAKTVDAVVFAQRQ